MGGTWRLRHESFIQNQAQDQTHAEDTMCRPEQESSMDLPASSHAVASRTITRLDGPCMRIVDDALAIEEPLEIRIGAEPIAVTMRTPGWDAELAAGFCLTESIITNPDDIESILPCNEAKFGNVIVVTLSPEAASKRAEQVRCARREFYVSSSCGLCGKQSIDRLHQKLAPITGEFTVTRDVLESLPGAMRSAQATFDSTGGLHAAGLFTPDGKLIVLREDVGRHNAVDKVIGHQLLLGQLPLNQHVLLVSGRTSFEILQKAAMAGIAMIAAVGAPSSLAVDLAKQCNITLVGFLRPGRLNLYHDTSRVLL